MTMSRKPAKPRGGNTVQDAAQDGDADRPCAICGRPSAAPYRPFCSKRCADVDLNRWLGEQYRIPSEEMPGSDHEDGGGDR